MNKYFAWNEEKNVLLCKKYNFGFERIVIELSEGGLLDDRRHPNTERYGHQRQLIVNIENYIYVVPYVINENEVFLKTFFPSHKATKKYLI